MFTDLSQAFAEDIAWVVGRGHGKNGTGEISGRFFSGTKVPLKFEVMGDLWSLNSKAFAEVFALESEQAQKNITRPEYDLQGYMSILMAKGSSKFKLLQDMMPDYSFGFQCSGSLHPMPENFRPEVIEGELHRPDKEDNGLGSKVGRKLIRDRDLDKRPPPTTHPPVQLQHLDIIMRQIQSKQTTQQAKEKSAHKDAGGKESNFVSCRSSRRVGLGLWNSGKASTVQSSGTESHQIEETLDRKRKQKKRQEVFWEISSKPSKSDASQGEVQELVEKLMGIRKQVETDIPEAIARLEYASRALFQEMARGYFLPLCSIAVASVARIRVLLQNLASQILYEWVAWERGLDDAYGKSMIQSSIAWDAQMRKELQESFHPPKEGSTSERIQTDQTRALLSQLGIDLDSKEGASAEDTANMERRSNAKKVSSVPHDADADLGEQLAGQVADKEDEFIPDYMATAINHVQTKLAIQKKAKEESSFSTAKKIQSGTVSERSADGPDEKEPSSDQNRSKAKKKKKRKDLSKPKQFKKAKSGDFFDNLFR
eukprot:scaffold6091_cov164-Amphora_coffeaeformis.AAC.2